jgi:type I restriction enzyme, S subunit
MTPAELIAAFEALAEAPEGVARLRELILQLAMCGRLVSQNPKDEPADVLLENIAAASAKGPRQERRRQSQGDVRQGAVPFEIPIGWRWARFSEVAGIASNLVDPGKFPSEPHIAPDNIEKVTGRLLAFRTIGEDGVTSGKHRFRAGQILYSKIRPNLSKVVTVDFAGLCSADMYPIDPWIDRGYLFRYMLSLPFIKQVTSDDNRLAMPKVNQEQLSAVLVPVPPLAEQRRIVARVEELMDLLERLEAARTKREATRAAARDSVLAALREADSPEAVDAAWTRFAQRMDDVLCDPADIAPLRQAVLQLAVRGRLVQQDPKDEPVASLAKSVVAKRRTSRGQSADSSVEPLFSVPSNWRWLRMDAVTDLASGVTKGRSLVGRKTTALPYLRVANVQAGFLDLKVIKTIDVPNDEIDEGLLLRGGDVLLTEGGDWDKLGRSAIWNGEVAPCTHQNHVFRARPLGAMDPRWISMFTNSPDGRSYFQSCAKRTTNLASINMTQLRACPVPVPPVAEQRRIVARVQELMGRLDGLEQRFAAQKAAHAAFAGAAVHHVVA